MHKEMISGLSSGSGTTPLRPIIIRAETVWFRNYHEIGSIRIGARPMFTLLLLSLVSPSPSTDRPRARDAGMIIGQMQPGELNAITDVPGVLVGHATVRKEATVCTGITVILPHDGNLFEEKVPAAIYVWNGFGKLVRDRLQHGRGAPRSRGQEAHHRGRVLKNEGMSPLLK